MNVSEALNSRYSCRGFKPNPVDKEIILNILEASRHAPSWANTQPWEIFVACGANLEKLRQSYLKNFQKNTPANPDIPAPQKWPENLKRRTEELMKFRFSILGVEREDKTARRSLSENNYKFFNAPAVIYLCMDKLLSSWSMFDLGLFAQSIMLVAKEYGLESVPAFMLVSYPELIRSELGIPENLSIVIGIALGYGDLNHPLNQVKSNRRPVEEIVVFKGI